MDPDEALLGPSPNALVATFHENERPLQGLAGLLDWRFHGAVSVFLRAGVIRGQPGEVAYFPLARDGGTFHVILIGAGCSRKPGERQRLDAPILEALRSRLEKLRLERIGVSRSDFGQVNETYFSENLPEIPLCIIL